MDTLQAKFEAIYGAKADFYAEAPGRVNLIGEHIDYCGYSVLPMAIDQSVKIMVMPNNSNTVSIASTTFDSFTCDAAKLADPIDLENLQWYHYIFCGFRAIQELFNLDQSIGVNLLVHGDIPMGAGLSSSSALVVCAALAFQQANQLTAKSDRTQLANACARAERHIGTCGGGMDQSICLLAEQGAAKLIHFNPLTTERVQLPVDAKFVVAHSLTKKEKALSNDFNQRVVECRLAALCLQKYKFNKINLANIPKLKTVQEGYGVSIESMLNQLDFTFARDNKKAAEPYTRAEVLSQLAISEDELKKHVLSANTQDMDTFWLYKRAEHVFSEAFRVHQFARICNSAATVNSTIKLGLMMDGSHWSCSKGYQCSSAELDTLTDAARDAGALGSRLTGAGWGGCTVSLIQAEDENTFVDKVKRTFYDGKETTNDTIFVTSPNKAAGVYDSNGNQLF